MFFTSDQKEESAGVPSNSTVFALPARAPRHHVLPPALFPPERCSHGKDRGPSSLARIAIDASGFAALQSVALVRMISESLFTTRG
jgi:hypothetical protein